MQSISRHAPTAVPSVANAALRKPTLSLGSTHPDVAELQRLLRRYVRPAVSSGIFDSLTEYAVKVFQYRMFLTEDGGVGLRTWQALYAGAPVNMPVLRFGSRSGAVRFVQEVLGVGNFLGANALDGFFGRHTERAVFGFQRRFGLLADAVVGPSTWHALSKARLEDPTLSIAAFEPLENQQRHQGRITSIATSDRNDVNEKIATASTDTTVRLWEVFGRPVEPPYVGDRGAVSSVAFHPTRQQFASGTFGGTVRVANFSLSTPTIFPARGGSVIDLAVDPAARFIATANGDGAVRLFNFDGSLKREIARPGEGGFSHVRTVAVSPRGQQLAVASLVGGVRLWDNPLSPHGAVNPLPAASSAHLACFSPHGYKLATAAGKVLRIYGNQRHELLVDEYPAGISALAFSGSGRYLAVGCLNNKVYMFDLQASSDENKIPFELEGHGAPISAVAFGGLPQAYFYSADEAGRLITWNILYDLPISQ